MKQSWSDILTKLMFVVGGFICIGVSLGWLAAIGLMSMLAAYTYDTRKDLRS